MARGITPAYAGKSATSRPAAISRLGSPPRMRGKALAFGGESGRAGITPAYAGKSNCNPGSPQHWLDHPRMCGEKTKKIP